MKLREIVAHIESFAPLALQEEYDNAGLFYGDLDSDIDNVLITLDLTEAILTEAISKKCNLIVSHHPVAIKGIKYLRGTTEMERIIVKAIESKIAIYSAHTNVDAVLAGVSGKMAAMLGLTNLKVLEPKRDELVKLVTYVPVEYAETVRKALFTAGAGVIGHYDQCSFNSVGEGTFRGDQSTNPFVGEQGAMHAEPEVRVETVLPRYLSSQVVKALINAHPYEEVAYDIFPLLNEWPMAGFGIVGDLSIPVDEMDFLKQVKDVFNCGAIKYTHLRGRKVSRVALCGGSGSSLLKRAIASGADIFISSDFKYHQFFDAEGKIVIADIGHYESEQFTKELFFELLTKKIPNFAVHLSEVNSNPIKYL